MRLKQANREFVNGYFSTHQRGEKTQSAYASDLAQFMEFVGKNRELRSVKGPVIERWAAHLKQQEYAPASIRRKIVVLKVFCSYWVRRGVLRESPFWRVKISFGRIQQLPRTLTEAETRALLSHARVARGKRQPQSAAKKTPKPLQPSHGGYRKLRDLALVDLLFATGMRV